MQRALLDQAREVAQKFVNLFSVVARAPFHYPADSELDGPLVGMDERKGLRNNQAVAADRGFRSGGQNRAYNYAPDFDHRTLGLQHDPVQISIL